MILPQLFDEPIQIIHFQIGIQLKIHFLCKVKDEKRFFSFCNQLQPPQNCQGQSLVLGMDSNADKLMKRKKEEEEEEKEKKKKKKKKKKNETHLSIFKLK